MPIKELHRQAQHKQAFEDALKTYSGVEPTHIPIPKKAEQPIPTSTGITRTEGSLLSF
jgi:hypothetical protein